MYRRSDGQLIVSATDLVGFLACGHLTQLERAAAAGLIKRPNREDPEVELLRRRGYEHEERYIREKLAGRHVTRLPDSDAAGEALPLATRAAQTREAMERGDDVIFQATIFDGRWRGHPDFLLRVGQPGRLGKDHHYEIADTKLAHSAKASALIQICSYVDGIEPIQNVRPQHVYVALGGAVVHEERFRTAELMAYYRYAKARFEEALDEAISGAPVWPIPRAASYPDPVEHCTVCRWFPDYCRRQWRGDDALPLVAGISRAQRQVLTAHEITTRRGLSVLTRPLELDLKTGAADSMWRMREQARLQVASDGLPVPVYELLEPEKDPAGGVVPDRGLSALPGPSAGDLFFDIEGDPFAFWEGLEYLFGIWGGGEYRSFWALNRDEERRAFEELMDLFMERWEADPHMHIYHYAPYEPTALKRLAGRHATREEELDRLLRGRRFVDLYRVVRQGVRVGSERYSIKNLEPLYGYEREIKLRDANSSIVEFEKVLEIGDPDGTLKEQIRLYNRDDCISTERLRDWLEERRTEAAAEWGELPRPPSEIEQPSVELTARQAAVLDLERRLTAGIPSYASEQSDADKATWLVAHLLDWHRREDKSTWWRYYDLLSKTDTELLTEPEPIAGLQFVDAFDPGGRSRSLHYRYRFPPQEHKVETGSAVHDPALPGRNKGTGEVAAIDDAAGTIDIRRAKTWSGRHPTSIVPVNFIDPKAQREALMRFGNWVAEHGMESQVPEWRTGRDLIRRRPPRVRHGDGGALVRPDETGTDSACRLVDALDGTTLAIQGPPGSGKTYTGARMILELVALGRRVAISSNSHKVIGNLLAAVLVTARETGQSVRAIQKAKEHEALHDPLVRRTDHNHDVAAALKAGEVDVAAGTPWLWADADLDSSVDTLFVDEAGQVSLANVIAMAASARNIVLLGDPQQLDQPTQGVHPDGAAASALRHFLGDEETVPPSRGIFLEKTWRMHPRITAYTSELFYEDKLESVDGLEQQRVAGDGWLSGSGLRWVPVEHDGNTNESPEEAAKVAEIWRALIGRTWIDAKGRALPIGPEQIVIVSPFNAHRLLISSLLGRQARVGTVDKFQGQEAPVSIYTMATSRAEDAPRGLSFLYSLNRLNVATSRARALAIVVCSPALLRAVPNSPAQLRMVNGLCAFVEVAPRMA
ncbi:MAG: TM0106 family RecB-like putative nuclease [Chloroflexota bacterium]|nr:TM0106 family RecB-like putative nuclease [Chloroflexota bacterium]